MRASNNNEDKLRPNLDNLPERFRTESDWTASGKTESSCNYTKTSIRGIDKKRGMEDAEAVEGGEIATRLTNLPISKQVKAMEMAFAKSHKDVHAEDEGSTATVVAAAVKDNKLSAVAGYVGDSPAYVVIIRKNGNVDAIALNPEFHDANNAKEVHAITGKDEKSELSRKAHHRVAGKLINGRLGSALGINLTRSIGDDAYNTFGISHVAQFGMALNVALAKGDRAFIVAGCDGIMEHCKGAGAAEVYKNQLIEVFQEVLKTTKQPTTKQLSEAIVEFALSTNAAKNKVPSTDNISAVVVEATGPVLVGVYDGHGGKRVAEYLGNNHFDNIQKSMLRLEKDEAARDANMERKIRQSESAWQPGVKPEQREPVMQTTRSKRQAAGALFAHSEQADSAHALKGDDARYAMLMDLKNLLAEKSFPANHALHLLKKELATVNKEELDGKLEEANILLQIETHDIEPTQEPERRSQEYVLDSDDDEHSETFFPDEVEDHSFKRAVKNDYENMTEAVTQLIQSLRNSEYDPKNATDNFVKVKEMFVEPQQRQAKKP